jgi:hypothetical protein
MKAQIGAVYCPTCKQDTLPLPSGKCGWCDSWIVSDEEEPQEEEVPLITRRAVRHPDLVFSDLPACEVARARLHPAFGRCLRATGRFTPLTQIEREQHVAGIVRMIEGVER